jgi:hypothetical protein
MSIKGLTFRPVFYKIDKHESGGLLRLPPGFLFGAWSREEIGMIAENGSVSKWS